MKLRILLILAVGVVGLFFHEYPAQLVAFSHTTGGVLAGFATTTAHVFASYIGSVIRR